MGTPDFAVPTLIELVGRGHEVAAVYTRAAKPAGRRGLEIQETPVALKAREFAIPVLTPKTLRSDEALGEFTAHKADAAVVVAYGLILPVPILEAVPLGCFNVHASLLPRWRGAAPINRAIMAGDAESGVCVMQMAEGLDTGPVALRGSDADCVRHDGWRSARCTGGAWRTDDAGALGALERGTLQLTPQPEAGVTYAAKIDKGETRIDWESRGATCTTIAAGCRRFPAHGSSLRWSAHQGAAHDARRGERRTRHRAGRPHDRVR